MKGYRNIIVVSLVFALLMGLGIWAHSRALAGRGRLLAALQEEMRRNDATFGDVRHEVALLRQAKTAQDQEEQIDDGNLIMALKEDLTALGAIHQSLTTGARTQKKGIARTPVRAIFNLSFPDVVELLKRMDAYSHLLQVQRLVIRRDPTLPSPHLKMSMQMEAIIPLVSQEPAP